MIGTMGDLDDFKVQHAIWGYAIQGDVREFSAAVAEVEGAVAIDPAWDRTAHDLAFEFVSRDDGRLRRVKDWAALPYVTEHLMRGHAPWPGL